LEGWSSGKVEGWAGGEEKGEGVEGEG